MPRKYKNVLGFRPSANYSPESLEECLLAMRIKHVTQRAAEKKEFLKQHTQEQTTVAGKHSGKMFRMLEVARPSWFSRLRVGKYFV